MKIEGLWTVRKRDSRTGLWVVRKQVHNRFTNYGTTALASALSGGYTAPTYLAIENTYTTPVTQGNIGDTHIILAARIDQAGDTSLVLGAQGAASEPVTFTSVTGSGPYTYTLSAGLNHTHPITDICTRNVSPLDTMSNVLSEIQYDATNFPTQRMQSPGGYSAGTGNWTVQFYFAGGTASGWIITCGMADTLTIGTGNLHNHFILAYNNNDPTSDLEIDGSITLTN